MQDRLDAIELISRNALYMFEVISLIPASDTLPTLLFEAAAEDGNLDRG